MLKFFSVENFKNFKDRIDINFQDVAGYQFSTDCIKEGTISKLLIYGKNATGKTNLGNAILDIKKILNNRFPYSDLDGSFLNANSSKDYASFSFTFKFADDEVNYQYSRISNQELRSEELFLNNNLIFKCDFEKKEFNFDNLYRISADTANIERYQHAFESENDSENELESRLPFLRWLINNVVFPNDSTIIKLANYITKMTSVSGMARKNLMLYNNFFRDLEAEDKLGNLEEFLNIMGIDCKLVFKKLPDDRLELYFAHSKLIPFFKNASSGTLALVDLYRRLLSQAWVASLLYIDEFDAFYHYEMSENVIKYLKRKLPDCQIIMTSHNTNLINNRLMRPDCLFIISSAGILTPLFRATKRELREGHNLEKMYISGEFDDYE